MKKKMKQSDLLLPGMTKVGITIRETLQEKFRAIQAALRRTHGFTVLSSSL